jgi:hypothetical protein
MSKRSLRVSIHFYGKHMERIPHEHGLRTEDEQRNVPGSANVRKRQPKLRGITSPHPRHGLNKLFQHRIDNIGPPDKLDRI